MEMLVVREMFVFGEKFAVREMFVSWKCCFGDVCCEVHVNVIKM